MLSDSAHLSFLEILASTFIQRDRSFRIDLHVENLLDLMVFTFWSVKAAASTADVWKSSHFLSVFREDHECSIRSLSKVDAYVDAVFAKDCGHVNKRLEGETFGYNPCLSPVVMRSGRSPITLLYPNPPSN